MFSWTNVAASFLKQSLLDIGQPQYGHQIVPYLLQVIILADSPNVNFQKDQMTLTAVIKMD